MALSLYRKYRPNIFADVVGQEHVERTLINAVTEGNIAHAYLFCGPRGTGKTTTARLLAKALLCEAGPNREPCGTCAQCQAIADGTHPDVYELDAASRTGVENVRNEIISRVHFAPTQGRCKVYIIDEVHMLTDAAFNALLKTLEEPPAHVVFIMCTTDPQKVLETIQSRCQRFDFRRFSIEEIVEYLERICNGEGFEYERGALEFLAARSAGGMRDATTALEQVAVFSDGHVTEEQTFALFGQLDENRLFELAGLIANHDARGCLLWLDQLVATGADLRQFAQELAVHLRNLYVAQVTGGEGGIIAASSDQIARYREQAGQFGGTDRLSNALTVCGQLVNELKSSTDARLSIEIAFVRLTRAECDLTLESLAERVEALEAGGIQVRPAVAAQAAEPDWGTVTPEQPRWRQMAEERNSQPTQAAAGATAAESIPLAEAAAREKEREEAAHFEALDARETAAEQAHADSAAQDDAPAAQPAAESGMSTARLLAALLTVVKREDVATGALLNGVTLDQSSDGYVLLFPKGSEFAMKIASGTEASALIGRAFEEVLGQTPRFACKLATGADATAHATPAEPAPAFGDEAPVYDEPPYVDEPYPAGYDEPDFDDAEGGYAAPVDDETAADFAQALSVFGNGVKVQEVRNDNQ